MIRRRRGTEYFRPLPRLAPIEEPTGCSNLGLANALDVRSDPSLGATAMRSLLRRSRISRSSLRLAAEDFEATTQRLVLRFAFFAFAFFAFAFFGMLLS
jgi:hypothetical protein